eukprot:FR736246.1.p1 GENE.FR736246.1~~FR736246.1.p1  ORF type:complete len:195 (+),score=29.23 FR736246.1:80-586(+)
MRMAGTLPTGAGGPEKAEKKEPGPNASDFEKAMYYKPAFEDLFRSKSDKGDTNAVNVITEYLNSPTMAKERYSKTYGDLIKEIEKSLNEVTSPRVAFSGFPSNMGEAGIKMTLEALGPVVEFSSEESDDGLCLQGKVEFEDVATAELAIEKYDQMDMGLGNKLLMRSL